jgi:hypothetical protein
MKLHSKYTGLILNLPSAAVFDGSTFAFIPAHSHYLFNPYFTPGDVISWKLPSSTRLPVCFFLFAVKHHS